MIRIVIENFLLFLTPTAIYVTYVWLTRDAATKGSPLDDAPVVWLFGAGAMLVVIVLVAFGTTSGGKPGQTYIPPVFKDGQVIPGRSE
jgi:hypothetical protein